MEYPVYTITREYDDGDVVLTCCTTNEHYAHFVFTDEKELLKRQQQLAQRYKGAQFTLTLKKDDFPVQVFIVTAGDEEVKI